MATFEEVRTTYKARMLERYMAKLPEAVMETMTPEARADLVASMRTGVDEFVDDLFDSLKELVIPVVLDEVVEVETSIAATASVAGSVTNAAVSVSGDAALAVTGRTKRTQNADGSYDIDETYVAWSATRHAATIPLTNLSVTRSAGQPAIVPNAYTLEATQLGGVWKFYWNNQSSGQYALWPTGQAIAIEGGEAGRLAFTPGAQPTGGFLVDLVDVVAGARTAAAGTVNASGSLANAAVTASGDVTGTVGVNRLVMRGQFVFAPPTTEAPDA